MGFSLFSDKPILLILLIIFQSTFPAAKRAVKLVLDALGPEMRRGNVETLHLRAISTSAPVGHVDHDVGPHPYESI